MSKYHVTTKRTKDTKDWEIITFQFLNFVLFANFVVIMSVSILVAA
jgi:nitrate reductase NapE component